MRVGDKPRIAIVGAGLGGVTAAILLQKAGQHVVVYERAPQLARVGAGINLGPNLLKVMEKAGVAHRMKEVGVNITSSLSRVWDTGEILWNRLDVEAESRFGWGPIAMHRGDMIDVMAEAVAPGTIQFNKELIGIEQGDTGTKLVFADGTSHEADIIIGADGVNSKVREIILGPEPPTYTGFVAYRSIFPTAALGDYRLGSDSAKWWSDDRHPAAEDRHFIIYYLTNRRDEVYFVTGSPEPNWPGGVSSIPATKAEIKTCYEGFHEEIQRVIDAADNISKWPLLERNPLPLWSEGNIVVLGDACHPMKPHMGQGAAMAIEDAAVLVRCILAADGNYSTAFDLYRANRIDRTSRVQQESHINVWMKYPTDPTWLFEYDATTVPLTSAG